MLCVVVHSVGVGTVYCGCGVGAMVCGVVWCVVLVCGVPYIV